MKNFLQSLLSAACCLPFMAIGCFALWLMYSGCYPDEKPPITAPQNYRVLRADTDTEAIDSCLQQGWTVAGFRDSRLLLLKPVVPAKMTPVKGLKK